MPIKKENTEVHLLVKRREIMFSLNKQGYTDAQVGRIFNISRGRANTILKEMPANYESPWIKVK